MSTVCSISTFSFLKYSILLLYYESGHGLSSRKRGNFPINLVLSFCLPFCACCAYRIRLRSGQIYMASKILTFIQHHIYGDSALLYQAREFDNLETFGLQHFRSLQQQSFEIIKTVFRASCNCIESRAPVKLVTNMRTFPLNMRNGYLVNLTLHKLKKGIWGEKLHFCWTIKLNYRNSNIRRESSEFFCISREKDFKCREETFDFSRVKLLKTKSKSEFYQSMHDLQIRFREVTDL